MKTDTRGPRAIETSITIAAPPEVVWEALTTAEGLTRWFPPEARVTPGAGGRVWLSWGEGMEGESRIEIWEPPLRLRTVEAPGASWTGGDASRSHEAAPSSLAVDYYLEGRNGGTVLRLVHSGFGASPGWDEEYDAVRNGWAYELQSLRHALERHRGRERRVALAQREVQRPAGEAMEALLGPRGLAREGRVAGLSAGAPYAVVTAVGERLTGRVVVPAGPNQFAATVAEYDDALLRVMAERCGGAPLVWVWLADWGHDAARVRAFEESWTHRLADLFG